MRTLLLTLLGFAWHIQCVGQGSAYPSADAGWCVLDYSSPPNGGWIWLDMTETPDTVIDGTVYQRVQSYKESGNQAYPWFWTYYVRSAPDGKGYVYLLDSLAEYMTIDLGALVGDTVFQVLAFDNTQNCPDQVSNSGFLFMDLIVVDIDTITNLGVSVVRHDLLPAYCTELIGPYFWQEGLGTSEGIITGVTSGLSEVRLRSGAINDTCFYNGPGNEYALLGGPSCCTVIPTAIAEPGGPTLVQAVPNPSNGVFNIQAPVGSVITVRDARSRVLFTGKEQVIDLSRYPAGCYFATVVSGKSVANLRLVVAR